MIFRQKQMRLSLPYIREYNLGFRFTTIWGGCIRGCHWKIPLSSIAGAFELWWKIDFWKTDLIISQPQNDIYLCLVLYEECIVEAVRLLLWLAGWWLSVVDMRRSPKQIFSSYGIPWIRVRLSILIAMFPFPPFFRGEAVSFTRCSGINNKQATKQWVSSFKRSCLNQHPVKATKTTSCWWILVSEHVQGCLYSLLLLDARMSSPDGPFFLTDFKIEPSTLHLLSGFAYRPKAN